MRPMSCAGAKKIIQTYSNQRPTIVERCFPSSTPLTQL
jgi:hypothetical protein